MQRKQLEKDSPPTSQNIMATILQSIPKEASVTKIEYEGPRIALYTNSPRYLMENNDTISNLVNIIKKELLLEPMNQLENLKLKLENLGRICS